MLYFNTEDYISKKKTTLHKSELFKNLEIVCNEVYPDRYELKTEFNLKYDIDYYDSFSEYFHELKKIKPSISLIIHFPETEVNNREFQKHQIKDLYFKISFTKGKEYFVVDFSGLRTTYTVAEIKSNYNHSHLSHTNLARIEDWKKFDNWCLGVSELANYRTLHNFEPYNLKMLLLLIPGYLSYESIEGRPYKYLRTIGISKTGLANLSSNYINYYWKKLYKVVDYSKIRLNHNFEIANFEEFEDNFNLELDSADYCYKIGNTYYPITQNESPFENLHDKFLFNFNNKPVHSIVENRITEIKSKKYVHPQITRYFANNFSKRIKELYHRKYGEDCQSNNTTESKKPDTISL